METKRQVLVVDYDTRWPQQFQAEADLLAAAFADNYVQAHHIGSTSIEGMRAKPIIDIQVEVASILRVDGQTQPMKTLGYEAKGEYGLPGRRYFQKFTESVRSHHVHVYEVGHADCRRHLAFRDYLNCHPSQAREYSQLKTELADKYPWDMAAYIAGKHELVQHLTKFALQWTTDTKISRQ